MLTVVSSFVLSQDCFRAACTHHMRWFAFACLFSDLFPTRGGFPILAVAVSLLLAFSCDVYHGQLKLCGAGAFGRSSVFGHSSYLKFVVLASSLSLESESHGNVCSLFLFIDAAHVYSLRLCSSCIRCDRSHLSLCLWEGFILSLVMCYTFVCEFFFDDGI